MRDNREAARIRLRNFYLAQAERFRKLADEYEPERYEENPLPINGYSCVVRVAGSTREEMAKQLDQATTEMHYLASGDDYEQSADVTFGSGYTIQYSRVYPEQTKESFAIDLSTWGEERKTRRRLREAK